MKKIISANYRLIIAYNYAGLATKRGTVYNIVIMHQKVNNE